MNLKSQPVIVPLIEVSDGEGGGKAAGLARLASIGLRVPRALVVLNAGAGRLPEGITEKWQSFGGGVAAVRSSGSNEDGEGASAAGQFETFLNVDPENLAGAVEDCLASADSERVSAYEHELSGTEGSAMSVVIQEMIQPSRAGVIFTADPGSGNRSRMIIEAVAGLGEDLVSGHAEAARYTIDATSGEVRDSSGDLENADLKPQLIEELHRGSTLASARWGVPLDLEWAVDSVDGALHWLQARPITALADSLDSEISPKDIITRANIGEMMPGAVTPLTLSTFGEALSSGLAIFYRKCGALRRREMDTDFVESVEDQLFMNISNMYLMAYRIAGASVEAIELSIFGYVLPPHETGRNASGLIRVLNGMRYAAIIFGWKRRMRELRNLARSFSIPTKDRSAAEIHADFMAGQKPVMDRAVSLHYIISGFSGAVSAALTAVLSGGSGQVSDEARSLMTDLLSGVDGVESAAVLEGLEELAGMIRGSDMEGALDREDPRAFHEILLEDRSEAGDFYRSFMERHGFRCIREAELHEPEWAVEPSHLMDSLKAIVQSPPREKSGPAQVALAHLKLPEGVNRKAVAWFTKQARIGVRIREESKSYLILAIYKFKTAARAMAATLESEGFLPEADLAYFLTKEEINDLLEGRGEGLIGRARRRRQRYPEKQEIRFPEYSFGRPEPEMPPVPEDCTNLRGTPVSRGIVEGSVRVVKTREDAEKLQMGEIMVAQFTDIGWTPFYGKVAGMVTEIGGALSHGSVVAREYGLPLVGGLNGACSILADGMQVRLDGSRGIVTVLDDERQIEPTGPRPAPTRWEK